MTEPTTIPLNRLALWDGNVRRTGIHDGIDELAASIAAHGLLQSLVVRKGKRGKYEIIAGQRRYLALSKLVDDRTIAKDFPVPCIVAEDSVDASELSLAENVVRAPMHPTDQFEAFRSLIDDGATVAEVAARFGVAESLISKRMKLGRLSPVILDAYRRDEIGLDEAQAFAVSDDHAAQERVLSDLPDWNRQAITIRRLLTEQEVSTDDKRVRFVGLDAYRAAGGTIRQDLFCEDGTGYIEDTALLDRLVADKLKAAAAEVSAEGWLWTDVATELGHQALAQFSRRYPEQIDLSHDDQAKLDGLAEEYDSLVDDDDANADRLTEIDEQITALQALTETWPAGTLAIAGAIVSLGYNGELRIERGLVRKQDLPGDAEPGEASAAGEQAAKSSGLSDRLVEDLTAEKSAAIGAALAGNPAIALVAVVHTLLLDLVYLGSSEQTCLKLRVSPPMLKASIAKPDASTGLAALAAEKDRLGDRLPGSPRDLWSWCLARSTPELLDLLAFAAGSAVDAVKRKPDRPGSSRLAHGDRLAEALKIDMAACYTPTADGYFARVSRAQVLAAIDEAKGGHGPALDKLKKSELAVRAEQLLAGTGWLPEPLRIAPAAATGDADDHSE